MGILDAAAIARQSPGSAHATAPRPAVFIKVRRDQVLRFAICCSDLPIVYSLALFETFPDDEHYKSKSIGSDKKDPMIAKMPD